MGHRIPVWDSWWELMKRIGGFPKWVRTFTLAEATSLTVVQRFAGKRWTTVAFQQEEGGMTVWGFFEEDIPHLQNDRWPDHDAEATPAWLIGMEEI